jgi:hypothetical protein
MTLTCYEPGFTPPFRYDAETGGCRNAAGESGSNDIPLAIIRETRDGECATVSGALNGSDVGYPRLVGWKLAGADLSRASLSFALLLDADLRGARLSGWEAGYVRVTAVTDAFTGAWTSRGGTATRCETRQGWLDCLQ